MTDLIQLNDRQFFILKALGEEAEAAPPPEDTGWLNLPKRTVYAFQIGDRLEALLSAGGRATHEERARGASNTLAALKRRKLAANDGGGVFIQNRWWITPLGVEQLRLRGVEL